MVRNPLTALVSRSARRSIAVCLVVGAGATLAGCSSDDNPTVRETNVDSERIVSAALEREGWIEVEGTVVDATGTSTPLSGAIGPGPVATGSGSLVAPVLLADQTLPTPARWTGGRLYLERTVGTASSGGFDSLVVRDAADRPWVEVPIGAFSLPLIEAYVPAEIVARADAKDLEFVAADGDGHFELSSALSVGLFADARVEVWADDDGAISRVVITAESMSADYTVAAADESAVTAPDPSEVAAPGDDTPAIEPTSAFAPVATGTSAGLDWSVLRADATNGASCWRITADGAPLDIAAPTGDAMRCLAAPEPGASREDAVQFLLSAPRDAAHPLLVVGVPDGLASARVGFVGGTTAALTVAQPLVFVGDGASLPGLVELTFSDGGVVNCGSGGVASLDDLTDDQLTAQVGDTPWTCIEA